MVKVAAMGVDTLQSDGTPEFHREYPVAQPGARQHGPGTHGDPDGILTGALDSDGFEYEQRSAPAYAPTDAVVRDSRRS
ncbi:hypothetical protein BRC69_00895 [Halobacteriales archaeon QH_6_66_25]|nr:MAG: hypothetical protein BRC69_00895 [Halobacteriales archaeon QH_6_66_25]